MLDKLLIDLENKIIILEDKLEADSNFTCEDEFQTIYDELIDFYTMIKDHEIDGFPSQEMSDTRNELFLKQENKFNKLESRINKIKEDYDLEDGLDSDWMFDDKEED